VVVSILVIHVDKPDLTSRGICRVHDFFIRNVARKLLLLSLLASTGVTADNAFRDFYPESAVGAVPAPAAESTTVDFDKLLEKELSNILPLDVANQAGQSNTAMRISILSARKSPRVGEKDAATDQSFLTVRVRVTNIHRKGLVSKDALEGKKDYTRGVSSPFGGGTKLPEKVERDYTVQVNNIADHFYIMADGFAHPMRPDIAELDENIKTSKGIKIKKQGQSQIFNLVFAVPEAAENYAIQYLDFSLGHIAIPLSGDFEAAIGAVGFNCPFETMKHALAEMCVHSVNTINQFEGYKPREGHQLVAVNLSAKSLSEDGSQAPILEIKSNGYLWLKDVNNHFAVARPANNGFLRFTPEVRSMQTAVFEVADEFEPHGVVVQIGSDVLQTIVGNSASIESSSSIAEFTDGDKMLVSLQELTRLGDYLVADISIRSLQPKKRLPIHLGRRFNLLLDDKEISFSGAVSENLAYGKRRTFEIPPLNTFRLRLAFKIASKPTAFRITGYDDSTDIDLSSVSIRTEDAEKLNAAIAQSSTNASARDSEAQSENNTSKRPDNKKSKEKAITTQTATARLAQLEASFEPVEALDIQLEESTPEYLEVEPNNSVEEATVIEAQNAAFKIIGQYDPQEKQKKDIDTFQITVEGEPQLWFFSLTGVSVSSLTIENKNKSLSFSRRKPSNAKQIIIPNAPLFAGEYTVTIDSKKADKEAALEYQFLATKIGPISATSEREPNNTPLIADKLHYGETRSGFLSDKTDRDYYTITVDAENENVALLLKPPPNDKIRLTLQERVAGGPLLNIDVMDSRLPGESVRGIFSLQPGTYVLTLMSLENGEILAPYQILASRLNRFETIVDTEPNSLIEFAKPLPNYSKFTGELTGARDSDWFKLPEGKGKIVIRLQGKLADEGARVFRAQFTNPSRKRIANLKWDEDSKLLVGEYDSETATHIQLLGSGAYEMTRTGESLKADNVVLPIKLDFLQSVTNIESFVEYGQRVDVPFRLTNLSENSETINIDSHISGEGWYVAKSPSDITIEPNGVIETKLSITAAPDTSTKSDVILDLNIFNDQGMTVSNSTVLAAACGAESIAPFDYWSLPVEMLGGIDVAWDTLGAELHGLDDLPQNARKVVSKRQQSFFTSGRDVQSYWRNNFTDKYDDEEVIIKLAGDEPQLIIGSVFRNPLNTSVNQTPTDIEILLSIDDKEYQSVWRGALPKTKREHAVLFENPMPARFAKMVVYSAGIKEKMAVLADWKIVASPGTGLPANEVINIGAKRFGGHVVTANNGQLFQKLVNLLGRPDKNKKHDRTNQDAEVEDHWVIGFHEQRAAKINSIRWHSTKNPKAYKRHSSPEKVTVQFSLQSPLGPWTSAGELAFDAGSMESDELSFANPTWARYVRFSVPAAEKKRAWLLPQLLEINEASNDEDYYSILGEWGEDTSKSHYELLNGSVEAKPDSTVSNNLTKNTAATLPFETSVSNQVLLGEYDNWYIVDVKEGNNRLEFEVQGQPTISMQFKLTDADSNPVSVSELRMSDGKLKIEAKVEPGRYFLQVLEPPRSIVITWDTSGSVRDYEFVNLLPFSKTAQPLLTDFSDNPAELSKALREQGTKADSSDAEASLFNAVKAMEVRPGTRAVVILTDADSGSNPKQTVELWSALSDIKPRIFTLEIHRGTNAAHQQDKMQNWAATQNGFYSKFYNDEQLRNGFARASCHLRRPAGYSIIASQRMEAPPEPGAIQLTQSEKKTELSSTDALEIILDASGSMHKKLGETTRLKVAQQILGDLVTNVIPEGKPVALRIFGHKESRSCRTDLEIPLSPANPAKLAKAIENTNAQPYAKTPLADSLAMVSKDLSSVKGGKNVILVTDGEESCNGDPAAAIAKLRNEGIDVRVNIVGFAIDDTELKKSFSEWAELGGGQYFDAPDAESLKAGMQQALQSPFEVINDAGDVIATGIVGGASIELPAGEYRVKVLSEPVVTLDSVVVASDSITTLVVD